MTSRRINLTLPYPPSVNRAYRVFNNRSILSAEGRAFKQAAALVARGHSPLDGDVSVTFKAYRPRKCGDLDNLFKLGLDALKGVAFHDDKQVVHIEAFRGDDKHNPRLEVYVAPAEPVAAEGGPR